MNYTLKLANLVNVLCSAKGSGIVALFESPPLCDPERRASTGAPTKDWAGVASSKRQASKRKRIRARSSKRARSSRRPR